MHFHKLMQIQLGNSSLPTSKHWQGRFLLFLCIWCHSSSWFWLKMIFPKLLLVECDKNDTFFVTSFCDLLLEFNIIPPVFLEVHKVFE